MAQKKQSLSVSNRLERPRKIERHSALFGAAAHLCAAVVCLLVLPTCESNEPQWADGEIAGYVYMSGPVEGAIVKVWQLGERGERLKLLGESEPSDADGRYQVDASVGVRNLLLEVEGSQVEATGVLPRYQELSNGARVDLDDRIILNTVVPDFKVDQLREHLVISPITTMATAHAFTRMKTAGQDEGIAEVAARSLSHFGAHFGDVTLLHTEPNVDFYADTDELELTEVAAYDERSRYGLMLGALSHLAQKIATVSGGSATSSNVLRLTQLLTEDVSDEDGLFDGRGPDGRLILGSCRKPAGCEGSECDTVCDFDANTLRSDFASSLLSFVQNSRNRRVAVGQVKPLMEDIRTNTDEELFPSDAELGDYDQGGADIAFDRPLGKFISGDSVTFRAAVQNDDLGTYRLRLEGIPARAIVVGDSNPNDAVVVVVVNPSLLQPGTLAVSAIAENEDGVHPPLIREFVVDDGTPTPVIERPEEGAVLCKPFQLVAQVSDNALESFTVTKPANLALKDDDQSPGRISTVVDVSGLLASKKLVDGEMILQVTALDKSANTGQAERRVVVDCTPPVFDGATVGGFSNPKNQRLYVAEEKQTITAEVSEKNEVVQFSVLVNSVEVASPTPVKGQSGRWGFSADVTLDPSSLLDGGGFSTQNIQIVATDAAGNASASDIFPVALDIEDPLVEVVPNAVDDESNFRAKFREGTAYPCLFVDSTVEATKTSLEMELNAADPGPVPQVVKYAVHHRPQGNCHGDGFVLNPNSGKKPEDWELVTDGNLITWKFAVSDNREEIPELQYRVVVPGKAATQLLNADVVEDEAGVTHQIVLTSDEFPELSAVQGIWRIELVATDATGRVASPIHPVQFDNQLLGGPLFFEKYDGWNRNVFLRSKVYMLPDTLKVGPPRNLLKMLFEGETSILPALAAYTVKNGTPYPALLSAASKGKAKVTREFAQTNKPVKSWKREHSGKGCPRWEPFDSDCGEKVRPDILPKAVQGRQTEDINFKIVVTDRNGTPTKKTDEEYEVPAFNNGAPGTAVAYVVTSPWTSFLWDDALYGSPKTYPVQFASGGPQVQRFGASSYYGTSKLTTAAKPGAEPTPAIFTDTKIRKTVYVKSLAVEIEEISYNRIWPSVRFSSSSKIITGKSALEKSRLSIARSIKADSR